jgi:hypothetical protein
MTTDQKDTPKKSPKTLEFNEPTGDFDWDFHLHRSVLSPLIRFMT